MIRELLSDRTGGAVFSCFGIWHLLCLLILFGGIAAAVHILQNGSETAKQRAIRIALHLAFGLYVLDFFLMPLAYGEIDIEKLPFHACTAMCVLSFWSVHDRRLADWRASFVRIGLLSNLVYVLYPAGVGWYRIHPLSYRVVQTLLFHGAMTAYGVFSLVFSDTAAEREQLDRDAAVLIGMTLWALLGNVLYNTEARCINWFFVVEDPFSLLPANIARWIMPLLVPAVFFLADLLLRTVLAVDKKKNRA